MDGASDFLPRAPFLRNAVRGFTSRNPLGLRLSVEKKHHTTSRILLGMRLSVEKTIIQPHASRQGRVFR